MPQLLPALLLFLFTPAVGIAGRPPGKSHSTDSETIRGILQSSVAFEHCSDSSRRDAIPSVFGLHHRTVYRQRPGCADEPVSKLRVIHTNCVRHSSFGRTLLAIALAFFVAAESAIASDLQFLNENCPIVDAHNCYPYDGRWSDRIDLALQAGFPVSIEQDLAWFVDPSTGNGRVVISHSPHTNALDPELNAYFFEKVRPIVEKALANGDSRHWPLIVLHFDFKDVQEPLLHAVWKLLGQHREWITTAVKSADPLVVTPLDPKPILVITEDSDAQAKVFYDERPVGSRLLLFGSAHTRLPATNDRKKLEYLEATLPPEQLLPDPATTYRRWWNSSWYTVEQGGQPAAVDWTSAGMVRLRALVDHAHQLGYWIRFYTLDGFDPSEGQRFGWFKDYNFGSLQAVELRWQAALEADVNFVATDQYQALAQFMKQQRHHMPKE